MSSVSNRTGVNSKGPIMRKLLIIFITVWLLITFSFESQAAEYEFQINSEEHVAENELNALFDSLPEDIRDKLITIDEDTASAISQKYNFTFFWSEFKEKFLQYLPEQLNMLSTMIGLIIVISLIKQFQNSLTTSKISPAVDMCSALVSALVTGTMQKSILNVTQSFLSTLSGTMMMTVPVMEAIYLSSGNYVVSAISSTGLNLMIAFTENLFANAVSPAITISFLISTIASVTQNRGITFISKTLRTIITTVIIVTMTLMTFSLTLQINASEAADNFTNRTIRFALGSYIPLIGGAVSETYSLFRSSLCLIKSLTGTTVIVILILVCLGPIISLFLSRFTITIAANMSGMLECDREEGLFNEISACYTLLISVMVSCALMYILAIAQFCKMTVMVA